MYVCDSGGGCPDNKTKIGERCHCDHYNSSKEYYPIHYCVCGADFYRPMFAPVFSDNVLTMPYNTVLAGDFECILAIRVDRTESKLNDDK